MLTKRVINGIIVAALFVIIFIVFSLFPQEAKADPVAGATKVIADTIRLESLEPPTSGCNRYLIDCLNETSDELDEEEAQRKKEEKEKKEQEEKKKKKQQKVEPSFVYASSNTLNRSNGVFQGPSGKESYYNLNMSRVVQYMQQLGYNYKYWIRKDGVKMYGNYVMVAANLNIRPKGTILQSSLGPAIVVDTGSFARTNPYALDVAVSW